MGAIRWTRRLLSLLWGVALVALVVLAGWSHVADVVIIQGRSMAPAVPVGSLVQPRPIAPELVDDGDIVTVAADNGVLVTHRVQRVVELPQGRFFELKGDANSSPDPVLVPASALVGRADFVIPLLGYVLAMLATPLGVGSIVALLGAVLVAGWLLEDAEAAAVWRQRHAARGRGEARRAPGH